MKLLASLIFSILFLLQSCSSSQVIKEKPDFTLTGAAAEKEIEKFSLHRVTTKRGHFANEPMLTFVDSKKLKPFMQEVSPKSVEMLDATKSKEIISMVIMAAWLSTIFIKDSDGNISPLYWVGLGSSLGYNFYLNFQRENVVDQFNKDLKAKFAPVVGYNFTY